MWENPVWTTFQWPLVPGCEENHLIGTFGTQTETSPFIQPDHLYNLSFYVILLAFTHYPPRCNCHSLQLGVCIKQSQCRATKGRRQWANKLGGRLNNCGLSAACGKHSPTVCMCQWLWPCLRVCSCWQQTWETKVPQPHALPLDCSCCWYLNVMQVSALLPLWSCHCAHISCVSSVHKSTLHMYARLLTIVCRGYSG